MEMVLQTYDLSKSFGSKKAVDAVNMTIGKGEIYGFVGRNGAGKTTLMRMILGHALPSSGRFELFGGMPTDKARARIGSLVETPGFYKNCSGRENLMRFAKLYGADPKTVDDILRLVRLEDTGNKKAGKYSLGMKQRLGIGVALLNNPDFIILDEPVNGLDPAGIQEVRELILKLNREREVTFLISSHLLEELSKVATRFGIIDQGKLLEEVNAQDLAGKDGSRIRFVVNDPEAAWALLIPVVGEENLMRRDFALLVRQGGNDAAYLNRLLVEAGIDVSGIGHESGGLEQYYLERVGG